MNRPVDERITPQTRLYAVHQLKPERQYRRQHVALSIAASICNVKIVELLKGKLERQGEWDPSQFCSPFWERQVCSLLRSVLGVDILAVKSPCPRVKGK